jgi:aspartate carbamoyltransferase catalytic subunit
MKRHFLSAADLSPNSINFLLQRCFYFSNQSLPPQILNHHVVANLFFENSTRTRFSFEIAQKKLGAICINFQEQNSSLSKGESFYDTLKTLESLGVNIAVIRHSSEHLIESVKDKINFSLINAGSGKNQHPSQALLDLFTIKQHFNRLDGLKIAICGDIIHSRVANSFCQMMQHFDSQIYLCGPELLLPSQVAMNSKIKLAKIDNIIDQIDVIMMLRMQLERHLHIEIDQGNYLDLYGLNKSRAKKLKPDAIIMHPAPVNRGIEIDGDLIESKQSKIYQQSKNGVYARMAIMEWVLTGEEK